jgi:hypothetical protein
LETNTAQSWIVFGVIFVGPLGDGGWTSFYQISSPTFFASLFLSVLIANIVLAPRTVVGTWKMFNKSRLTQGSDQLFEQ